MTCHILVIRKVYYTQKLAVVVRGIGGGTFMKEMQNILEIRENDHEYPCDVDGFNFRRLLLNPRTFYAVHMIGSSSHMPQTSEKFRPLLHLDVRNCLVLYCAMEG